MSVGSVVKSSTLTSMCIFFLCFLFSLISPDRGLSVLMIISKNILFLFCLFLFFQFSVSLIFVFFLIIFFFMLILSFICSSSFLNTFYTLFDLSLFIFKMRFYRQHIIGSCFLYVVC